MTESEKIEKLKEKTGVSEEDARAALEQSDWDLLDAVVLLERSGKTDGETSRHSTKAESAETAESDSRSRFNRHASGFWEQAKHIIQIGNENSFVISHKEKQLISLPVTVLVLLFLLFRLWLLAALAVGLFCGLRYSMHGEQLGKPEVNDVMDKAANAAENVRETVEDSLRSGK